MHGIKTTEDFVVKVTLFILSSAYKYEVELLSRKIEVNILDKFLITIIF